MSSSNIITSMQTLIMDFSEQTHALALDFTEDKNHAEWSLKYPIMKLQFVLTKKEKIMCPISTLFCRIYLSKNDVYFYHLPELMEYLEPENFQCYYFPYIESEQRIEACFSVIQDFLLKHLAAMQMMAKDTELCTGIQDAKQEEIKALFMEEIKEAELEEYAVHGYETYVLLPRYAGESAYREFVCGNYEKALKLYGQISAKGALTSYEKRLCKFIEGLTEVYAAIPEECDTVRNVRKLNAPSGEGLSILLAVLVCEVVLGAVFAGVVAVINGILSSGTVYYAGMQWYYAFLFAGTPAIFGGIALRNHVRRLLQKTYQENSAFDKLLNPPWVELFARSVFGAALVIMLFMCVCTSFMSTRFYKEYMTYEDGEELIPGEPVSCSYADLKAVYYSEGLYNDFGDFIDRPSYLLEFADGTVWDSDAYISVEETEIYVLPLLKSYYDEIVHIEDRTQKID